MMAETTHAAHSEVPSEGHKGPFPPFQKDTFASQLVWLTIFFVILYVMMAKLAIPRIGGIIAARQGRIGADLEQAKQLKDQSDATLAAYEKAIADARSRAQTIAGETRAELNAAAEARRKQLGAELNVKLAAAETSIAAAKAAAMSNVRGIAIEAAGAIVERLIGVVPPAAAVDKAVDAALQR
jgi:F-type H+-transporting ATPase subunit b